MRAGGKAKAKGYSVGGGAGAKRGKKKIVPTKAPRTYKRAKKMTPAQEKVQKALKRASKAELPKTKTQRMATAKPKKMQKGGKMMSKGGATGGRRRMNGKKNMGLYGRK